MSLNQLQGDLIGLEMKIGREIERDVIEGKRPTGRATVVQVMTHRG